MPSTTTATAGVARTARSRCNNAGTTFVHPEGAHNFVNTGKAVDGVTPVQTEFYIVYVVPAGASPAAIDVTPAPAGCPA